MSKVVVVDLCGTLVFENTTQGYLRSLALTPVSRLRQRLLRGRLGAALNRGMGRDVARELLIRDLRGIRQATLDESSMIYASRVLQEKPRKTLVDELTRRRNTGDTLYLATSSIEPVARAVTAVLSLHGYVATALGIDGEGRCTGRIVSDLTGVKWQALADKYPQIRRSHVTVYTDNPEDTDLKAAASEFHFLG